MRLFILKYIYLIKLIGLNNLKGLILKELGLVNVEGVKEHWPCFL